MRCSTRANVWWVGYLGCGLVDAYDCGEGNFRLIVIVVPLWGRRVYGGIRGDCHNGVYVLVIVE